MLLPQEATQSEIEEMRRALGLDRPLIEQYFTWLQQVLTGDLGNSLFTSRPVVVEVLDRFPNTILLTVTSIALAVIFGLPLGILAAVKRGSSIDTSSMIASVVGWSMPNFWIGLMLIILFGVWLRWLPTSGMYDLMAEEKTLGDLVRHLILPSFTLAVSHMAYVARFTRFLAA